MPRQVVGVMVGVGLLFVLIGAIITASASRVSEIEVEYSSVCCESNCSGGVQKDKNPCEVNFTLDGDMSGPVHVYYRLENFFASYRDYVKSRDDGQLHGEAKLPSATDCDYDRNFAVQGIEKTSVGTYEVNSSLDLLSNVISPCGLISKSWFNDSFALFKDGMHIPLNQKGISWKTDRELKFRNAGDGSTGNNFEPFRQWKTASCDDLPDPGEISACSDARLQAYLRWCDQLATNVDACKDAQANVANWGQFRNFSLYGEAHPSFPGWCYPDSGYCVEDEHFIVWMRTAALSTARKMYATVDGAFDVLEKGDYTLKIWSTKNTSIGGQGPVHTLGHSLYPVHQFGGSKSVVLGTLSFMDGGKNPTLGIIYLSVGAAFIAMAIAFAAKNACSPRKPGVAPFLYWGNGTPKLS